MAKKKKPARAVVQPGYSVHTLKGMAHSGAIVRAKDLKCEDPEGRFQKLIDNDLLRLVDETAEEKAAEEAQAKADKEAAEAEAAQEKADKEKAEAEAAAKEAEAAKKKAAAKKKK